MIPWVGETWGIVMNKPDAVERLNWHARQVLLSRLANHKLSLEENKRYFSHWRADYLRFHLKAVSDITKAQDRAKLKSIPVKALSFTELYRTGKLKILNATVACKNDSLIRLRASGKSCRVELTIPDSILTLSYDVLKIYVRMKPKSDDSITPFTNYVRIYWMSKSQREYSGERSIPLDLYSLEKGEYIEADMSKNLQWLTGIEVKKILMIFYLSSECDIGLGKIEFRSAPSGATLMTF